MKEQVLKAVVMLTLILTLAFVTAVASANAQTHPQVQASVPFEFTVGDRTLPAGRYTIEPAISSTPATGIAIDNQSGSRVAMRLTNSTEATTDESRARLVFHRYGERYFLAEVWDGTRNGLGLLKSGEERAIERELRQRPQSELALNNVPETITIIANLQ